MDSMMMKDLLIGAAMTVFFIGGVVGTYYGIINNGSLWWAVLAGINIGLYNGVVRHG